MSNTLQQVKKKNHEREKKYKWKIRLRTLLNAIVAINKTYRFNMISNRIMSFNLLEATTYLTIFTI